MLDVILLLLILFLLDDLVFPHSLGVRVKVSSVVRQLLLCQPDDVRAHSIQEILQAGVSCEPCPSASPILDANDSSANCLLDSPMGHAQCFHQKPQSMHLSHQAAVVGALMLVHTINTCRSR